MLNVGDKEVLLLEVGPAHTAGDILVHVPKDKTVFTGDILFIDGHPVIWRGQFLIGSEPAIKFWQWMWTSLCRAMAL